MRRFLLSGLDQGLIAALNLSLSLILIRTATPADYGAFMLWQNSAMILTSLQGALVSVHLTVLVPHDGDPSHRAAAERMLGSVNLLLTATVLSVGLALSTVALVVEGRGSAYLMPAAFYVTGILAYQYTRALALSRADLGSALKVDLIFAVCAWTGTGFLWWSHAGIPVAELITLMASSAVLAATVGLSVQKNGWSFSLRWPVLREYRAVRKDSFWALLGVITTELQGRSYIYIIGWLYGAAALGELFAAQFLSRPLVLVYVSWSMMARPQLAGLRGAADRGRFVAVATRGALLLTGASLLYYTAVYLFWDEIRARLYAGTYSGVGPAAATWAAITLLTAPNAALSVGLEALREFRLLFLETACTSVVSLGAVLALASTIGSRASLAGLATAQALGLVLVVAFFRHASRRHGGGSLGRRAVTLSGSR